MKFKKEDKKIQELLKVDTNLLILSDKKLIKYIDYVIADSQLFTLFSKSVKKTDNTESLILKDISEFVEDLKIHFDKTKIKTYTENNISKYKELDCDEYIEFLHRLLFN